MAINGGTITRPTPERSEVAVRAGQLVQYAYTGVLRAVWV